MEVGAFLISFVKFKLERFLVHESIKVKKFEVVNACTCLFEFVLYINNREE